MTAGRVTAMPDWDVLLTGLGVLIVIAISVVAWRIRRKERLHGWTPYDSDSKITNPLPPVNPGGGVGLYSDLVWVFDAFYEGVTLAYWTQNGDDASTGWWVGIGGHTDDIGVTHWMPLERPDAPPGAVE